MTDDQPRYTTKRLQDEIVRAKDYARRDALEEAATIAEGTAGTFDFQKALADCDDQNVGAATARNEIARQIRALISTATPAPVPHLLGYQDRVAEAHHALFHDDPTDIEERLARFFEEVNETCQALGMSREDAHKLVDYTYDRPAGEVRKEIGAAALTLASLCVVASIDLMECAEADLEKLQRPETIARIRAKRATRHGRGPLPGIDPSAFSPAPPVDAATFTQHMESFRSFVAQTAPNLHWKVWHVVGTIPSVYEGGFDGWRHGFGMVQLEAAPLPDLMEKMKTALRAAIATGDQP